MSSSALIAARKRVETSLKKIEIPTQDDPEKAEDCSNGSLYLSLLQSRFNWSTSVFVKYKPDSEQQPRRAVITRRKWPNMKYIGHCTLHAGPHLFEDTIFYEANRFESWTDIITAHQNVKSPSKKKKPNKESDKELEDQESTDSVEKQEGQKIESESPMESTETAMNIDSSQKDNNEEETVTDDMQLDPTENHDAPQHVLKWTDIVFELKDVPSERFVFPKESLVSVNDDPLQLRASFTLPLDPAIADEFFGEPINKILKYGHTCNIEYVQNIIKAENHKPKLTYEQYEPTNILLSNINSELVDALKKTVDDSREVKKILSLKAGLFPRKKYIQYSNTTKMNEMEALLNRILTMPDLLTGPIMAEKKRNEILNAIKLGKRERDEKFEAELPKTKLPGVRDESILRCSYCATKYTTMWRSGPGGHGTLCNSCGIQWKREEILKGASMISLNEERKVLKEKRERDRQSEALEMERTERENKKHQKKQERGTIDMAVLDSQTDNTSTFAAQLIQQRQAKSKNISSSPVNNESLQKLAPVCTSKQTPNTTLISAPLPKVFTSTQTANTLQPAQSYSLYSSGGIPLPTLSVDFGGTLVFAHPNCGITLLDSFFSIRLCKDGHEPMLIQFDKKELADSVFQVLNEGGLQNPREVLKMIVATEPKKITAYGSTATVDKEYPITVRFLEKLDPSGGAVVQRILQRWLITFLQ
ncbi:hypothetical protein CU098_011851 [Rhizopus stolonifer]|uniref:GATA-type domain-containing protein n=1 Tax=Rhizopus stolonifer TaxID=4846 RepID=A0A367KR09_RHIST|nr:hypothetical protein CU098_011851 [Rhizopus stolonifer]